MTQLPESKFTGRPGSLTVLHQAAGKGETVEAAEARDKMYQGVTMQDMEVLFRMDRRTIIPKIGDVKSCGSRGRYKLYQIRDVAPYLVKPAGDIEDYIKRMRPNDLPPLLSKEFWNGQRAKLAYLESEEDVWRTDKVIEVLSGVFKQVRMSLLLLPDQLDRVSALNDEQQTQVRATVDSVLEGLQHAIVEQFGDSQLEPGPGGNETPDDLFYVPEAYLEQEDEEEDL